MQKTHRPVRQAHVDWLCARLSTGSEPGVATQETFPEQGRMSSGTKVSGTRADRPGFGQDAEMLREGDFWSSWKLDQLGRSVANRSIWSAICKHGVQFRAHRLHRHRHTHPGGSSSTSAASLTKWSTRLTVERTPRRAGSRQQLGRKGDRKPKMTDSKRSGRPKKLLALAGVPPGQWPRTSACPFRRCTAGARYPRTLSVLYFRF